MKCRNLMAGAAAAVMCAAMLGGCSNSDTSTVVNTVEPGYWEAQEVDSIKGNAFIEIASSENMQLLLHPRTATLRWMDTETGLYRDTNLTNNANIAAAKDNEKSDAIVSFYSGTYSNLYQTSTNYDTYSMGVDRKQYSYQYIDNGVRVIYALGDDSVTYKNFPYYISAERMEEFVLQYMSATEREAFTKNFYQQMSDGTWVRKSNKDAPLGSMAAEGLYEIFYVTGSYNEEELMADLEEWGVDAEEYPSNLMIRFAIDYTLEDGELVVTLDTSKIESDDDHPIRSINLLPYFMTSNLVAAAEETADEEDAEEAGAEGYMFVPDGSGALIYLDSTKTTETNYSASFYGGDKLVNADTYTALEKELMLPVFGMKTEETTILGVIENGAEVATLSTYINGSLKSEPYCKMQLTFDIRTQQIMTTDSSDSFSVYKVSEDVYDEEIRVRYYWLGQDAEYVDMANCYREYLEENGELTAEAVEEDASFFVELLGVTDKTKYLLGIPYEGTEVMTSFEQVKEILSDMNAAGVKNVKLIYSGMLNGGMNQRSLTNGVSFAPDLGGSKAFSSLLDYASSIGVEVYPNLMLQSAYTKKGLSGSNAAYNIVNAMAKIYEFDPVQEKVDEDSTYPNIIVNPNYLTEYLADAKSSYTSKTGLTTLASSDFLTYYGTNYRDGHVAPGSADDIYDAALKDLADGMKLMLSNPVSEAYGYSAYLTDIPTTDSGARMLDASIPFTQMVLDGYKTYSSESLNLETTDIQTEFMRTIESKSAPKFTFTYGDSAALEGTKQSDLFAIDYKYWKEELGTYYAEYQEYYDLVKDAVIEKHELFEKNEKLRIVTYSNGVTIYFNYSDLDEKIDGVSVPAFSYKIEK